VHVPLAGMEFEVCRGDEDQETCSSRRIWRTFDMEGNRFILVVNVWLSCHHLDLGNKKDPRCPNCGSSVD